MFFSILKLFGLDVRAKIAAARTEFEQRAELAKSRIAHAVMTAGILAVLFGIAALAALAALGVGLGALYAWVSITYGPFYAYGAVAGVLVILSIVFAAIGILEAKSWSNEPAPAAVQPNLAVAAAADGAPSDRSIHAVDTAEVGDPEVATEYLRTPAGRLPTGSGMSEPLALLLSRVVRLPVTGNPVVDDMITALRGPAHSAAADVINSTADVIRHGERQKMIAVLGAAILVGWFLERLRSRQRASN
jgi:hypothetical protein